MFIGQMATHTGFERKFVKGMVKYWKHEPRGHPHYDEAIQAMIELYNTRPV